MRLNVVEYPSSKKTNLRPKFISHGSVTAEMKRNFILKYQQELEKLQNEIEQIGAELCNYIYSEDRPDEDEQFVGRYNELYETLKQLQETLNFNIQELERLKLLEL